MTKLPETCEQHIQLAVDIATIREKLQHIESSYWRACIISGFIGGLLGKLVPDVFEFIIKLSGF